ncbi:S8 family peptidase [Flavivirga amylovorans]|uniref:S8 family peptidase n=1 Tax=Flavivirga amylovorans TaxID=870486 RepID=A0ABT8X0S0_9FLAO|nr:S8 family peptidase [Flavivirga amylovorans]MDO5987531.1 S8 family peptidase [Flavivirga amylovorans]
MNNRFNICAVVATCYFLLLATGCKTIQSTTSNLVPTPIVNNGALTFKQTALPEDVLPIWSYLDLVSDSISGMSLDKAKQIVANKKVKPLIVAVIDSGTDLEHEVLQGLVWSNPKEVVGNQKDDDSNGYIDDINGWNFLADAYGAPLAITRLVAKCEELCTEENRKDTFCSRCEPLQKEYDVASEKASEAYSNTVHWYNEATTSEAHKLAYDHILALNQYHYNPLYNPREIIGDNVNDLNDKYYGNNSVLPQEKSETHGTHVAGIAVKITRQFTDAIKYLPIRAIPNGDEYDKDVALAIRYAVDSGAKVINMSFGKAYSEHPDWVQEAIKYAASKDVLMVHAAGNNSKNIDESKVFPNDQNANDNEIADNMITVGAITRYFNEALVSEFSNYGEKNVDIFAPGSKIYSALPNNEYGYQQGTSMAAPAVAAVAGLVRSYYPKLSASQVKHILMNSGIEVPFEVYVPGKPGEKQPFSELCKSGRILNAYNALLMAEKMSKNK